MYLQISGQCWLDYKKIKFQDHMEIGSGVPHPGARILAIGIWNCSCVLKEPL